MCGMGVKVVGSCSSRLRVLMIVSRNRIVRKCNERRRSEMSEVGMPRMEQIVSAGL